MFRKGEELVTPQIVVYKDLAEEVQDALRLLYEGTKQLSQSFEDSIGHCYQSNFEQIVRVVLIYDNLRKPNMPLHGIPKKELFLSPKNKNAIIR
jgi:hypothetical protein